MKRLKNELNLRMAYFLVGLKVRYNYRNYSSPIKDAKPLAFLMVLILICVFVIGAYAFNNSRTPQQDVATNTSITTSDSAKYEDTSTPTPVPVNSDSSSTSVAASDAATEGSWYAIDKVVDGDTIRVFINGESVRVRLIGIDTPETVDPRRQPECYGYEASTYAKGLMQPGDSVRLVADVSQGDTDKYGRLLRYVYLQDGTNVAYATIRGGYGEEYTYNLPYRFRTDFMSAESAAKQEVIGLWKFC